MALLGQAEYEAQMRAHRFMFGCDQGSPQFDGQDPTETYHDLTEAEQKEVRRGDFAPDFLTLTLADLDRALDQ